MLESAPRAIINRYRQHARKKIFIAAAACLALVAFVFIAGTATGALPAPQIKSSTPLASTFKNTIPVNDAEKNAGKATFKYILTTLDGQRPKAQEVVTFDDEGLCIQSNITAEFDNSEASAEFANRVKSDYGLQCLSSYSEGTVAYVVVDMSGNRLSSSEYEAALRKTVDSLEVVSSNVPLNKTKDKVVSDAEKYAGETTFKYILTTTDGQHPKTQEVVTFDDEGLCIQSRITAEFDNAESAAGFVSRVKSDYRSKCLSSYSEGNAAYAVLDMSENYLSRSKYEASLRELVDSLEVL